MRSPLDRGCVDGTLAHNPIMGNVNVAHKAVRDARRTTLDLMQSDARTVRDYLASLPDDRRLALQTVRGIIRKNLPQGIVEAMNWGMIAYEIPLATYPATYNGQPLMFAALASQKNHMAVYLSGVYGSSELRTQFDEDYKASGKKMDVGKSCVRFRKLDDLPLDVIGRAIAACSVEQFIATHDSAMSARTSARAAK